MQINAINSFSNVQFEGKKHKQNKPAQISQIDDKQPKQFMKKLAGPVAAVMFLAPGMVVPTSCTKIEFDVDAEANANQTTIVPKDTVQVKDTVHVRDTVYIPPEFEFPYEIEDSLNHWRGEIVDVPVEGDDGEYDNRALLYVEGQRDWEYRKPESFKLNLEKSNNDEARYDHEITDSIKNDTRVTLVKPGEITVVRKDGTITDQVSGLLFNEDGVKTFAHSNGKDKIFIYPKATSGKYQGKYVELGTAEPGYLYDIDEQGKRVVMPEYGHNMLLNSIISPGTEDHYVNINGKVVKVEDIIKAAGGSIVVESKINKQNN